MARNFIDRCFEAVAPVHAVRRSAARTALQFLNSGYGNCVMIDHGNGFLTLYGHLTQATVEVGDKVKQGDQIGLMGSTGYSTGTHLHFELRYEGYVTNPASFVSY